MMLPEFRVEHDDVLKVPSDLLLLKYAQSFYGADGRVASVLEKSGARLLRDLHPSPDEFVIVETRGAIAASRVMFLGTPPLNVFSYAQMRHFAARSISTSRHTAASTTERSSNCLAIWRRRFGVSLTARTRPRRLSSSDGS